MPSNLVEDDFCGQHNTTETVQRALNMQCSRAVTPHLYRSMFNKNAITNAKRCSPFFSETSSDEYTPNSWTASPTPDEPPRTRTLSSFLGKIRCMRMNAERCSRDKVCIACGCFHSLSRQAGQRECDRSKTEPSVKTERHGAAKAADGRER